MNEPAQVGEGGMTCLVHIRKEATGEVRVHHEQYDWCNYQWGLGNYSCDCNRHLFFERAAGKECLGGQGCGESAYTITQVVGSDGQIIFEGDPRS